MQALTVPMSLTPLCCRKAAQHIAHSCGQRLTSLTLQFRQGEFVGLAYAPGESTLDVDPELVVVRGEN